MKNAGNGYPIEKMYIPENSELKAADGPTDLQLVLEHNPGLLDSREGKAIYEHLKQDTLTDILFQEYIATCYINESDIEQESENRQLLYGVSTKNGLTRLNQTGKVVTISEFREIVSLVQKLTTFELFNQLRKAYPSITFQQIQEAVFQSYDENYPETMMNAKQYAVPVTEEQEKISEALSRNDYTYYEEIKRKLVETGAFKNIEDINKKVDQLLSKAIDLGKNQKNIFEVDER